MSGDTGAKCVRCQQALPAGTGYCMSCGFDNGDIEAKKFGLMQKSQGRIDRARSLSKFYRLMRFVGFIR